MSPSKPREEEEEEQEEEDEEEEEDATGRTLLNLSSMHTSTKSPRHEREETTKMRELSRVHDNENCVPIKLFKRGKTSTRLRKTRSEEPNSFITQD